MVLILMCIVCYFKYNFKQYLLIMSKYSDQARITLRNMNLFFIFFINVYNMTFSNCFYFSVHLKLMLYIAISCIHTFNLIFE